MPAAKAKIRVVIIDDSPTVRSLLASILSSAGMDVLALGNDGEDAVRLVKQHKPDVVTLDVRMPKMDGFEATRRIMREQPTPIVIVTGSMKYQDVDLAFQAMRAGALAVVNKPGLSDPQTCEKVVQTVQNMAGVRVIHHWGNVQSQPPKIKVDEKTLRLLDLSRYPEIRLIGIAASTGGPSALATVLKDLPPDYPLPIVAVQHVSPGFTGGLVEWLSSVIQIQVDVATHGDRLKPGTVIFAPDDYHIQVNQRGEVELSHSPSYKGLRPSANPMFESLAQHYGKRSMGVILTGMGDDGANGIENLHQTGALIIAQDEKSCVVYGMPQQAVLRNAIDVQMNLEEIARVLKSLGQTKITTFKQENGAL